MSGRGKGGTDSVEPETDPPGRVIEIMEAMPTLSLEESWETEIQGKQARSVKLFFLTIIACLREMKL